MGKVERRGCEGESKKPASVCGGREGWDTTKIGGKKGSGKGGKN